MRREPAEGRLKVVALITMDVAFWPMPLVALAALAMTGPATRIVGAFRVTLPFRPLRWAWPPTPPLLLSVPVMVMLAPAVRLMRPPSLPGGLPSPVLAPGAEVLM